MNQDNQDKKQIKEYQKNPMSNFSDSINHSMVSNLKGLTKGGCLTKIITLIIIIIGGLLILSQCSH
ncbi:DUF6366 family protein [Niallia sp. 01092]|uniref:DUF6366 family protein n=1 Tax=Niallia sp. 01092 TaxID=3457759 RepID=UPI003FD3E9D9